jgi:hypothetical protein
MRSKSLTSNGNLPIPGSPEYEDELGELYDLIKRIYGACMHEEGSGVVGFTGEVHISQELFDDIFEAVNVAVYRTGSMWPKGTIHD